MSEEKDNKPTSNQPPVLSREEARKKREYHLALAAQREKERGPEDDNEATDATVATMVLPGD